MKNKLKYGLTLAALTFLVGCSNKESIQRPSIGSGSTSQDSSSIISGESTNSNTSDTTSDSTSSEIDPFELNNYQYYPLPDKTLAIAAGNNKYLEKLTLPEQYQGRKVTQIAENGFEGCRALKEIDIPSSVLTVGNYAFSGCSALSNIVIPESVTSIGNSTFSGCSALSSIVIPNSVTNIGDWAFCGCSSLAEIAIPEGVTAIGNYAFEGCPSLKGIVIPEGVTSIGDSAFLRCVSLTSIVIPEGVTNIGYSAFWGCSSLTICCKARSKPSGWDSRWNDSGRPVIWECSGIGTSGSLNYRIDYKNGEESITITRCAGTDSEAVIPEKIGGIKVTAIADSAFEGCTSLTSVVIPEGVTNIGDSAFKGCSNLTICCKAKSEPGGWSSSWNPSYRPVVWGYIRAGDQDCFEYAVSSIDGVECATITGYAGSDTGIAVPETIGGIKVAAIANSAFAGCTFLTSIAIPDGVTNIGYAAFYGCSSLASIAIPNSVTNIGGGAFAECTSLTSINIPESVTSIGNSAFYGCSSLASIVIPEGVTTIGDYSFWGCSSLTSIVIPNSVRAIGEYAFRGCSRLTICCKAQSKPSGWHYRWNDSGCPVVWGYSGDGTSGSLN
ncbi:MAG: leucine-rich repeat domain-containing protein [Candidatus Enteromonas sp.]|nr:leucine-rich repeat domain-containing protein [Candidatus Enteromonas sp.]